MCPRPSSGDHNNYYIKNRPLQLGVRLPPVRLGVIEKKISKHGSFIHIKGKN